LLSFLLPSSPSPEALMTAGLGQQNLLPVAFAHTSEQIGMPAHRHWLPLAALTVDSVLYACQSLCAKKLSQAGIVPLEIVVLRGVFMILWCISGLPVEGRPMATWLGETFQEVRLLGLRALLGFCGISFGFAALSMLPLAEYQVLLQTMPIFSSLFALLFLGERWHCSEAMGAIAAALGVVLSAGPELLHLFSDAGRRGDGSGSDLITGGGAQAALGAGAAYALMQVVCASGAGVVMRMLGTQLKVHWLLVMMYQGLGQVIFGAVNLYLSGQAWIPLEQQDALWALGLGLFCCLAQSAMTWGLQRVKVAMASVVMACVSPAIAMLLQAAFLPAERLSLRTVAAFGIISAGLAIAVAGKSWREAADKGEEEQVGYKKLSGP